MSSKVSGVFEQEGASPASKGVCFSAQLLLSTGEMGSLHCGLNHHTQSSLLSLIPPLPLEILTLSHLDAIEMGRAATHTDSCWPTQSLLLISSGPGTKCGQKVTHAKSEILRFLGKVRTQDVPPPSLSKRVPDYPLQTLQGGKPGQEPAGAHAHNLDFRIVFGFTEWALLKKCWLYCIFVSIQRVLCGRQKNLDM